MSNNEMLKIKNALVSMQKENNPMVTRVLTLRTQEELLLIKDLLVSDETLDDNIKTTLLGKVSELLVFIPTRKKK